MRTTACAALACCLLLSGCHTGYHRAQERREKIVDGESREEVRSSLGAPDRVVDNASAGMTWIYCYHTPFTMYVVPGTLCLTIVLTYPSALWLWALDYTHAGYVEVTIDAKGRVTERTLMLGCGCHP